MEVLVTEFLENSYHAYVGGEPQEGETVLADFNDWINWLVPFISKDDRWGTAKHHRTRTWLKLYSRLDICIQSVCVEYDPGDGEIIQNSITEVLALVPKGPRIPDA